MQAHTSVSTEPRRAQTQERPPQAVDVDPGRGEQGDPHQPVASTKGSPTDVRPRPPRLTMPPPRRATRLLFVVMSAVAKPGTVDQLARSLWPHPVLVHHDFAQTPQFTLNTPQVQFVPDPVRTGWAEFGFVDGIFHSLQHALNHIDFDYLQLLSPTCLPIKPLPDFERHVSGTHDAHFDAIDLSHDPDARLSVGYRTWTTEGSLGHRIARRLVNVYYGDSVGRRDEAGIWLRTGRSSSAWAGLAGWPLRAMARPARCGRMATQGLALHYGSVWFGARRHIIEGLVRTYRQPGLRDRFARMHIAEEFLLPSLLMHLHPRRGPMNHLVARFDGAHPRILGADQLQALRRSPAWFARKFPDDPQADVRHLVLEQLASTNLSPAQRQA